MTELTLAEHVARATVPTFMTGNCLQKHLHCSRSTLDNHIKGGVLPAPVSIGRLRRWRTVDLIEAGIIDPRVFEDQYAVA